MPFIPTIIFSICIAFIIAAIVFKIHNETGQMVLLEHLSDDWTYRLPYHLRNNRYRGLSRPSFQFLLLIFYILKAFVILTLCVYYYIFYGIAIAIKWVLNK